MKAFNTIERDIHRNAEERLIRWAADTVMRCDAVDIDRGTAASMIMGTLVNELALGAVKLNLPKASLIKTVGRIYDAIAAKGTQAWDAER